MIRWRPTTYVDSKRFPASAMNAVMTGEITWESGDGGTTGDKCTSPHHMAESAVVRCCCEFARLQHAVDMTGYYGTMQREELGIMYELGGEWMDEARGSIQTLRTKSAMPLNIFFETRGRNQKGKSVCPWRRLELRIQPFRSQYPQ